ncbi:MAG: ribosome-recycling factor [Candidatus Poribacteria bacterium]|nr:MAG: ribosome-recycling factor [Candidatus Poribacteria bacterium]
MRSPWVRDAESRMKKAVEATLHEFNTVRTGRASPALLESIQVEYYGTKTPLNQLASITAPEPRLLVVQPWDKNIVKEVEKAIARSPLGLVPSTDGNIIRIVLPELSEERRRDLARLVKKIAEDGRVAIRNIRRDVIDSIRKAERAGEISEDDSRREQEEIQKLTDRYIEEINQLLAEKEEELMTV